jgi:hypothetical protein
MPVIQAVHVPTDTYAAWALLQDSVRQWFAQASPVESYLTHILKMRYILCATSLQKLETQPMGKQSYAEIVRIRMKTAENAKGHPLTIRQLEKELDYSYEHIRKVVQGEPVVSRLLNDKLCDILLLNRDAMWDLAQKEKMERKFGPEIIAMSAPDSSLQTLWSQLSKESKKRVANLVRALADADSATAVAQ